MFARQFLRSAKTTQFGVRHVSARGVSTYVAKATGAVNSVVYWAKVTGEVAKQIYIKEGLAPPSIAQIETVYQSFYKYLLEASKTPKETILKAIESVKSIKKDEGFRYTAYFIQLVGLFSLGEIIGRRQVVGYPTFGPSEHAHH